MKYFKNNLFNYAKWLIVLKYFIDTANGSISFEDDVTLSSQQAKALAEFKDRVLHLLPADYMRDEIYLVKWLLARKFNVDRAEKLLKTHLAWRKRVNFDNLPEGFFSELEEEYPYVVAGVSRDYEPIIQWPMDEWELRNAVIAGKGDKLVLYIMKMVEKAWLNVRSLQQEGRNVTRFITLINLEKVSIQQHMAPATLTLYVQVLLAYESNFPKQTDEIILVNTPSFWEAATVVAKSVMDAETQKGLLIFGRDKQHWKKALDKIIANDQLVSVFGGTLQSKFDYAIQ